MDDMQIADMLALGDLTGIDPDLLTEEESAALPQPAGEAGFGENLAERLDEAELLRIGQDVLDGFESDETSRADWRLREKLGMRLLGISENPDKPPAFEGGSTAVFPGLIEAIIQFQARAMAELWPPEGPAKAVSEGVQLRPDVERQAKRVAEYLNWLMGERMPGGYQQHDRMLFRLPLSGACFKKVYFCPKSKCVVSRFVPAEDLLVPYGSSDLDSAPRISHVIRYSGTDLARLMEDGVYREIDIDTIADSDKTDLQPELDSVSGTKPSSTRLDDTEPRDVIEQSVYLDIDGEPKRAPYLVTALKDSGEVLAIYRDWREDDAELTRRQRFVDYNFLPGLDGFYGLGVLHVLCRLAESQSGNLRALLDAAHLANVKGGFRSADVRLPRTAIDKSGALRVTPGDWQPVDATSEELQKLFVTIPYGEPSQTLFNLLQWLDEVMRRIAGTTSELVGESTKNVPVGTTLARIEQGLRVQTQIQIRCHQSMQRELALISQITAETLPDARYCRDVLGVSPEQFALDFDGRIDIRPVSNPNAVTATQRLVIAQALVDMADKSPDLIDRKEAYRRLLDTMRVEDADKLLVGDQQPEHAGPVEENMAILLRKPVRAFPDQDHQAHLVVHRQWRMTLDPESLKAVEAPAMAHEAEHVALAYQIQMQQAMGLQAPPGVPLDPQQENLIAAMAAQAVQLMAQQQPAPAVDPAAISAASKAEADSAKAEAEIRRKDALAEADIQRSDAEMIARMNRQTAEQEAKLAAKFVSERGLQTLGEAPL